MTNLSSDPHSTPDRSLGWAPAAPTPAPAAAGSTMPQEANPFAVRHTAETIARLQMMQRLRDVARTDDEHCAQGDRDPGGGGRDTTDEMIYLRIHWAETTRYEADVHVSPYAADAELYAEIANVPEAMRRTRDVADTDNTITSIIDLDDDGRPNVLERAISASNTVSGQVDWGNLADTIDTRLAEGPDWPALSGALDRAAATGHDVPANLPRLAAQDPLPAHRPPRNCNTGSSRTPTRPSHQASATQTPALSAPPAAPSQRSATTQGDPNRQTPHPAGDATPSTQECQQP